jgi:site-specific DNA-methyltransferase (adenine-specific)
MSFSLHLGNCLDTLKLMADSSVDSIVTDPPYGLSFMGKKWDYDVPSVEIWAECLRVLKPGGHLLAFAGTRTQHRMAVRIEDAGFEIRDVIAWVYGSGFPKSLDVSKAIDKAAGAEREVVGRNPNDRDANSAIDFNGKGNGFITAPATEAARQWQGWGTALKPALEPITVARKPLGGTVAANVLEHGTGALNIDGCRVGGVESGRWPANLIHDGSDEVLAGFPVTKSGALTGGTNEYQSSEGSAARFFYCAKASKKDRDAGLEGFEEKAAPASSGNRLERMGSKSGPRANIHPTVKPTDLMGYLCRLVTPPGGIVLDPFMGSGSTGKAAVREGFRFIGCEMSPEYMAIADARIAFELYGDLA